MPDRENLAMKAVKSADLQPPGDHRVAGTHLPELMAADHAVLADHEPVQCFCVELCPTVGHISTQNGHAVDARRGGVTRRARCCLVHCRTCP